MTNVQLYHTSVTMATVVTSSVVIRALVMLDTLGHIVVKKLMNVSRVRVKMVQHVTTKLQPMHAGAPISIKELTVTLTLTNVWMLIFAMVVTVETLVVALVVSVHPHGKVCDAPMTSTSGG